MSKFEARPDSGVIMSVDSKRSEKSPDYWGEIAIDMKNQTNVRTENGLTIIRLSGWKRHGKNGKSFLSIAVDRYERRQQEKPQRKDEDDDNLDF